MSSFIIAKIHTCIDIYVLKRIYYEVSKILSISNKTSLRGTYRYFATHSLPLILSLPRECRIVSIMHLLQNHVKPHDIPVMNEGSMELSGSTMTDILWYEGGFKHCFNSWIYFAWLYIKNGRGIHIPLLIVYLKHGILFKLQLSYICQINYISSVNTEFTKVYKIYYYLIISSVVTESSHVH